MLNGLLFDPHGDPLICHFASKKGRRYYYYISKAQIDGENTKSQMRLPIRMIEQTVVNLVASLLKDTTELFSHLRIEAPSTERAKVLTIKAIAEKYGVDHADAKSLVPLSYLTPSIVEDTLAGRQPADLNVKRLKTIVNKLPLNWRAQRQMLGFAN